MRIHTEKINNSIRKGAALTAVLWLAVGPVRVRQSRHAHNPHQCFQSHRLRRARRWRDRQHPRLQAALDAAAKAGGGIVELPVGIYLSGPAIDARLAGIRPGPLSTLFREGYRETEHFLSRSEEAMGDGMLTADVGAIENISRSLRKVSSVEIAKIERDVGFLATAGATTPFIGLFGTVWGIMSAFRSIGQAGSTSLAIVAPGISEALITTAIGLAVAIPAVIGFNYVQGKIKLFVSEIDNFCYDFLNIVQKIFNSKR